VHTTSDTAHSRHFNPAPARQKLFIGGKWPLAIVALGMVLTVIWMATLVWLFVAATGYASVMPTMIG